MIVPYGAYACAEGHVMLAIQTDREWRRFCSELMNDPMLADDPRFADNARRVANRVSLETMIETRFRRLNRAEVLRLLELADIPTASVNDVPAVAAHPQLAARGRWTTAGSPNGDIPALVPPHNIARAPARIGRVPALGEHTRDVLGALDA
jgi:crotonobetainyl-CoA:carnitine CoA-transferase CaiB-like acyl-CoA transferase